MVETADRIASHPDDPAAPLADRLLLALGMWPSYVGELGAEAVVGAAAIVKAQAHRFPMAAEDFGFERDLRTELEAAARAAVAQLEEGHTAEALSILRAALAFVDDDDVEEVLADG